MYGNEVSRSVSGVAVGAVTPAVSAD